MSLPNRFDSTETGAPALNNAVGSLAAILIAVGVTGFNVKSVTAITVASGVATVQCPTHAYACGTGQLVKITGASVPALNGNKQPTLVDANNFTFPAPGVADGSYTATDARRAPLGWTVEYANAGDSTIILRRSAPEATSQMLRVNDSHASGGTATDARVVSVEAATGIDAFTGLAPTDAQQSGGFYWSKGVNSATAKAWSICANDTGIYLLLPTSNAAAGQFCYWTDLVSYFPGDAYGTVLSGSASSVAGGAAVNTRSFALQGLSNTLFSANNPAVQRGRSGTGTAVYVAPIGHQTTEGGSVGTTDFAQVPILRPVPVVESDGTFLNPPRGHLPGLAAPLANKPFTHNQLVSAGAQSYISWRTIGAGLLGNSLLSLNDDWS